jgi:hypothetical protein
MIKLTIVVRGDFIEIRPHQRGKSMGPNEIAAYRNGAPPPQNARRHKEDAADPSPGECLRPNEGEDKPRLEGEDSAEWKIPPGMPPLY